MAPAAAAATTTTFVLIFMLHSSLLLIHAFAPASDFDCTPARSYHPNPPHDLTHNLHYSNRKILMGVPKAQPTRPFYGVELRDVPSGPDPLHHSGSPQKRPRISP